MKLSTLPDSAKILSSWFVIVAAGIYTFYLAKNDIYKHRYEHMKYRERMRDSNRGEYNVKSRYKVINDFLQAEANNE